jgi:hypothetical protein
MTAVEIIRNSGGDGNRTEERVCMGSRAHTHTHTHTRSRAVYEAHCDHEHQESSQTRTLRENVRISLRLCLSAACDPHHLPLVSVLFRRKCVDKK